MGVAALSKWESVPFWAPATQTPVASAPRTDDFETSAAAWTAPPGARRARRPRWETAQSSPSKGSTSRSSAAKPDGNPMGTPRTPAVIGSAAFTARAHKTDRTESYSSSYTREGTATIPSGAPSGPYR